MEDICKECYIFANCHRHLANHTMRQDIGDDVRDSNDDDTDADVDSNLADDDGQPTVEANLMQAEAAQNTNEEVRELMLLQAAKHVKMARIQRLLYQQKVAEAVEDAKVGRTHRERRYTFVVDYGQNMELPIFNKEQPGVTYYYSPLSIYNLGIVDHAHDYGGGDIKEHLHCQVYHEGVGKKGANNVSSLIIKTLRDLNLLRNDEVGGELNIIFDNCSGQNKNNTVIKLAVWLSELGYFEKISFIFLVVGHTKNSADRLFNTMKKEYRKHNIFTFEDLVSKLGESDTVTIHQPNANDFLDYDKLLDGPYRKLAGHIKMNHIFTCDEMGDVMKLRQSNLLEHEETLVYLRKMHWKDVSQRELMEYAERVLTPIKCVGLNPYKMVEMWKNYRPVIPVEYQSDALYAKPSDKVMKKVKVEREDRSEFRAKLKEKKYASKKGVESTAFDGEEDKA